MSDRSMRERLSGWEPIAKRLFRLATAVSPVRPGEGEHPWTIVPDEVFDALVEMATQHRQIAEHRQIADADPSTPEGKALAAVQEALRRVERAIHDLNYVAPESRAALLPEKRSRIARVQVRELCKQLLKLISALEAESGEDF